MKTKKRRHDETAILAALQQAINDSRPVHSACMMWEGREVEFEFKVGYQGLHETVIIDASSFRFTTKPDSEVTTTNVSKLLREAREAALDSLLPRL